MMVGRVIGTVVATRKSDALVGQKLLLLQPLYSSYDGDPVLAPPDGRERARPDEPAQGVPVQQAPAQAAQVKDIPGQSAPGPDTLGPDTPGPGTPEPDTPGPDTPGPDTRVDPTRMQDTLGQDTYVSDASRQGGTAEKVLPAHTIVAVDTVGAGVGETVLVALGSAARKALSRPEAPVDAAIVGIIDSMKIEGGRPG